MSTSNNTIYSVLNDSMMESDTAVPFNMTCFSTNDTNTSDFVQILKNNVKEIIAIHLFLVIFIFLVVSFAYSLKPMYKIRQNMRANIAARVDEDFSRMHSNHIVRCDNTDQNGVQPENHSDQKN